MAVHLDLSVIAIIGIILLIGIVRKNGNYACRLRARGRAENEGLSPEIRSNRAFTILRPILMTTWRRFWASCRYVGTGGRIELRQPLGYTIVGWLALHPQILPPRYLRTPCLPISRTLEQFLLSRRLRGMQGRFGSLSRMSFD